MKITLEFDNAEDFYRDLPKFAALTGFSAQFANFEHVKKDDTKAQLKDPELPEVVKKDGAKFVKGTKEQRAKVDVAQTTSDAIDNAEKAKAKADPAPDSPKAEPKEAPKEDVPDIAAVRKVLHTVIKAGHKDEMKALLSELGASNVTSLDPSKYVEFITKAKEIGGVA